MQDTTRRIKKLEISAETFFTRYLKNRHVHYRQTTDLMPEDAKLVGVFMDPEMRKIILHIESAEFPEVQDGARMQSFELTFETIRCCNSEDNEKRGD